MNALTWVNPSLVWVLFTSIQNNFKNVTYPISFKNLYPVYWKMGV